MPSAPYHLSISATRAGALFASPLQRSDEPSAMQIRQAIAYRFPHAIELGAERIYVLPTENPGIRLLPRPPRGAPDAAVHALTRLFGARLQADLTRYATAAELIVLPAGNPQHIPLTSFTHASDLIEQALTAARTALAAHATHPARAQAS